MTSSIARLSQYNHEFDELEPEQPEPVVKVRKKRRLKAIKKVRVPRKLKTQAKQSQTKQPKTKINKKGLSALEQLIEWKRSPENKNPRAYAREVLFDSLSKIESATKSYLAFQELFDDDVQAKYSEFEFNDDKFSIVQLFDAEDRPLVFSYNNKFYLEGYIELPDDQGIIKLSDFYDSIRSGEFEFGTSAKDPKTWLQNFTEQLLKTKKKDITNEFKEDLEDMLIYSCSTPAGVVGKDFTKFLWQLQKWNKTLYTTLKSVYINRYGQFKQGLAGALWNTLEGRAEAILAEERKKEDTAVEEATLSSKIISFAKEIYANGLPAPTKTAIASWLMVAAGALGAFFAKDAAAKSPDKEPSKDTSSRQSNDAYELILITDSGDNPSWGPNSEEIVFYSNRAIYTIGINDTEPKKLADAPYTVAYPDWSPDGSRITYSEDGIYVMNSDGSNVKKISEDGDRPDWSPDNSKIAFDMFHDCEGNIQTSIFTMNADGTDAKRVTPCSDVELESYSHPKWSPDSQKMVLTKTELSGKVAIYIMNSDGTNIRKIHARVPNPNNDQVVPVWSPDGNKIAFTSTSQVNFSKLGGLYVYTDEGSETEYITEVDWPYSIDWSPDGSKLAFMKDGGIYYVNVNASDQTQDHWTPEQSEKIYRYAPTILHDSRPDTSQVSLYRPADSHGDNQDVTDNHENYDNSDLQWQFHYGEGEADIVYAKITEYPEEGYDVYTYVIYRNNNPHLSGIKFFAHEHDVQRIHVKVDRATEKPVELAVSQHLWMKKYDISDVSEIKLFSGWGDHESGLHGWEVGSDGKGYVLSNYNTHYRPLEELVAASDANAGGYYLTDEPHRSLPKGVKVPWLQQDVIDPKSAFGDSAGKKGWMKSELKSPGDLSVKLDDKVTDKSKNEIPNSGYSNNSIAVLGTDAADKPTIKVIGTSSGNYSLDVILAADAPYEFAARDIPISPGEVHTYTIDNWKALAAKDSGVTIKIDKDNNGKVEYSFKSDSELTQKEYLEKTKDKQDGKQPQPTFDYIKYIAGGIATAIGLTGLVAWYRRRKKKGKHAKTTSKLAELPEQTPKQDEYEQLYGSTATVSYEQASYDHGQEQYYEDQSWQEEQYNGWQQEPEQNHLTQEQYESQSYSQAEQHQQEETEKSDTEELDDLIERLK